MVRPVLLGSVFALGFAASAYADGDDVMAGYYGNTAVSTGGRAELHTTYNADHTFVMKVPAYGMEFKGTWAVNGSTLCRTYETPPPGVSNPLCTPIEPHKVGDTWSITADGNTRTITLVQGVQ
jgi:hypothetical protein